MHAKFLFPRQFLFQVCLPPKPTRRRRAQKKTLAQPKDERTETMCTSRRYTVSVQARLPQMSRNSRLSFQDFLERDCAIHTHDRVGLRSSSLSAITAIKTESSIAMAQLIVRQIEEKVVRRLKERAGAHGVSMEEEHRQILREALLGTPTKDRTFKDLLLAMPGVGDDADFARDP